MSNRAVVEQEGRRIARPLTVLVPLIQKDLEAAKEASERAGMPYYQAAGEKMLEAKAQMKHGEFGPWIKRNFSITAQHASRYMAFAKATSGQQNSRYENFSDFMRKDGGDPSYGKVVRRQDWHDPVKESLGRVNVDAIKQEGLRRAEERELVRKLCLQIIDIGYKALATKLHPDRGGSREAMARLNDARNRLKQCI